MLDFFRRFGNTDTPAQWKHGKVRCIILDDLKFTDKATYNFIKQRYPDYRDALLGGSSRGLCADLTRNDKLIIVSHSTQFGLRYAKMVDDFIHFLKLWGLREIGVLKFHCCNIGEREWLRVVGEKMLGNGISFSYISGPSSSGEKGHYTYDINRGLSYTSGEYKIIKGDIPRDFKGTRYVIKNGIQAYPRDPNQPNQYRIVRNY